MQQWRYVEKYENENKTTVGKIKKKNENEDKMRVGTKKKEKIYN